MINILSYGLGTAELSDVQFHHAMKNLRGVLCRTVEVEEGGDFMKVFNAIQKQYMCLILPPKSGRLKKIIETLATVGQYENERKYCSHGFDDVLTRLALLRHYCNGVVQRDDILRILLSFTTRNEILNANLCSPGFIGRLICDHQKLGIFWPRNLELDDNVEGWCKMMNDLILQNKEKTFVMWLLHLAKWAMYYMTVRTYNELHQLPNTLVNSVLTKIITTWKKRKYQSFERILSAIGNVLKSPTFSVSPLYVDDYNYSFILRKSVK